MRRQSGPVIPLSILCVPAAGMSRPQQVENLSNVFRRPAKTGTGLVPTGLIGRSWA